MKQVPETIDAVRRFWESNPLWVGESAHPPGSREFFREHRTVVIDDCFAGELDPRTLPDAEHRRAVLDLGCGIGFWTVELALRGCQDITAADLTETGLRLAGQRCQEYGANVVLSLQNAERMDFPDGKFSHVNCQGVIHHTPDAEACVREIARVLETGGTASISVYYRSVFLRAWPLLSWFGAILARFGARLPGRGRDRIYSAKHADEIVRLYDGSENPIGRSYSRPEFVRMLEQYFHVAQTYLHFFPARSLPFRIPRWLHRLLDRHAGFMIYATLRKKVS